MGLPEMLASTNRPGVSGGRSESLSPKGLLTSAIANLGSGLADQAARAAIDEARALTEQQIAGPINANLTAQTLATNQATTTGRQVSNIARADKVGCSIHRIKDINEHRLTTQKIAELHKKITALNKNIIDT